MQFAPHLAAPRFYSTKVKTGLGKAERDFLFTKPTHHQGDIVFLATAICSYVGRGLSGALESVSDTMCDVCNASLYKNSIVPASNDTKEPKTVLN